MKWRYTKRKYKGKNRRVKVHKKSDGGELVRVLKFRNRHD